MTKDEYVKKAKELGYSDESIQETIQIHEEAKKDLGIDLPYEMYLIELPINY